ncbi:unnamed protein product [Spodoptera exigua]|uniref:Uncharacterized protein n=1 Tax=Spodoptera exigua TaxID=7107 RepID=A0A835L1Z5_SPOEX|nr:hypothetical protein HW555_009264 [Spodoptera exigua]KAH9636773.1 hypothetical protein HF086_005096 [Spodoptera exigua]CAH0693938.1 unnamed protein product [Spodoptera exigua]
MTRGKPLPQAEILDQLLTKFLGHSYSDNTVGNIILGKSVGNKHVDPTSENLDINVLDVYSARKIISFAKQKHEERTIAELTRRQKNFRRFHKALVDTNPNNTYITDKAMHFLQQSIYATLARMNVTYPFQKKYHNYLSYQISVLYGSALATIAKMESLLAQMKTFTQKTHFIWFLFIYEKILTCNIDITNIVQRIFILHEEYIMNRGPKKGANDNAKAASPSPPSDFDEEAMHPPSHKRG